MSIVTLSVAGSIATISLDDGKANALSPTLLEELNAALDLAERDHQVVVLKGREGIFSGGFDLSVIGRGTDDSLALARAGSELTSRLLDFPTPVLAASRGHAIAMGAFLLLSCDFRIGVSGDFKYGLNEVAIGMTMPYAGIELARERLNAAFTDRAVNNAEIFAPEEAVAAGFLDRAVTPQDFDKAVLEQADRLAALDMTAHKNTKRKLRQSFLQRLAQARERDLTDFKTLFGLG